jgi:hypothetical protein
MSTAQTDLSLDSDAAEEIVGGIGEAKNEEPFIRAINIEQSKASKALFARSKALNQRYHLGAFAGK